MSVKIREAHPEDYDGVMDINKDVYGGLDYLPYKYHTYMKEGQLKGNRVFLLAETSEGQIVAFGMAFAVDDGKTLIPQAARVRPDYLGKGINNQIGNILLEKCKEKYGYTKLISTTWHHEIWERLEREGRSPMTITARSPRVSFETDCSALSSALDNAYRHGDALNKVFDETMVLPRDEGRKLLSSPALRDFIRSNFFVYSWDVFDLKFVSNVEWIMQCNNAIVRTMKKDGVLSGVSIGNILPCKLGTRMFVDIYCDEADVVIAHVVKHLELLKQYCKTSYLVGSFFLHQCSAKHKAEVKRFVAEFMDLKPKHNLNEKDFILLEGNQISRL